MIEQAPVERRSREVVGVGSGEGGDSPGAISSGVMVIKRSNWKMIRGMSREGGIPRICGSKL